MSAGDTAPGVYDATPDNSDCGVHTREREHSADSLSQQSNPHQHEWRLCPRIFNKILQHTQIRPRVDLFASFLNNQQERFVSWRPDPEAMAVNAYWTGETWGSYTCFLAKLTRDKIASAILISPLWPNRPWWPLLLESRIQPPLLLPQSQSLLTNPVGDSHYSPICNR